MPISDLLQHAMIMQNAWSSWHKNKACRKLVEKNERLESSAQHGLFSYALDIIKAGLNKIYIYIYL